MAKQKRPLLTKSQACLFRKRWRLVNAREEEETRNASLELRWQQLNTLMAWAIRLGSTAERRNGEGVGAMVPATKVV